MAIPKVTGYTGVIPDRRTQSAEDFTSAAVTWTDYQAETLVPSTNAAIDGMNAAQDEILASVNNAEESSFIAQAAANYQGPWSSGASVVKGESWSHNGLMWAANVTGAGEPQENTQWFLLKSEPELASIKVLLEQWGYRYVGLFDDGFTYSQVGDAGVDGNNSAWTYVGAGAPNKVVEAGTAPSAPDYERVDFNELLASNVLTSGGSNVQDYLGRVVVTEGGKKCQVVGAVIRNNGSGWRFIDDATHEPIGFSAISTNVDGTIKIEHTPDCNFVGSIVVCADETFARLGITAGGSIGRTFSNITITAPLTYYVNTETGQITAPSYFSQRMSASVTSSDCVVTHPAITSTTPPVVSSVGSTSTHSKIVVDYDNNTTTLLPVGNVGGYVSFSDEAWSYVGRNSTPPTFSWSSGVLTITHQRSEPTMVNITGRGAYNYNAGSISDVVTEVEIRDNTGSLVITQDSGMKLFFSRESESILNDGLRGRFAVNRGQCIVNANDLVSSVGNFWILGLMQIDQLV